MARNVRKWCLSAGLIAGVLALSMSREFYDSSITSVFLSLAIGSAFVTVVVLRRSWPDVLAVSGLAVLLLLWDVRLLHFPYKFFGCFSFLGMSSLVVLGIHAIWSNKDRMRMLCGFLPALLFIGSEYMATDLLDFTEKLHPKVFDLYLYSFDCSLRVQISFGLGKLLYNLPWVRLVSLLFYIALPLPLALVYAARLRQSIRSAIPTMLAFLATGPLGVLFYNMLPACGPAHLFARLFPLYPPAITDVMHWQIQTLLIPQAARNAIPSLHMAWVLLVWWSSRTLPRWIRSIAFVFLAFTTLATMGLGEHYFVDLVVAFPFAVMIVALCSYTIPFSNLARRVAFLWGVFATLLWLALLSFAVQIFWITPVLPWAMVSTTIAVSCILQRRLQIALDLEVADRIPAKTMLVQKAAAQHA
jgi:hypothetical protein